MSGNEKKREILAPKTAPTQTALHPDRSHPSGPQHFRFQLFLVWPPPPTAPTLRGVHSSGPNPFGSPPGPPPPVWALTICSHSFSPLLLRDPGNPPGCPGREVRVNVERGASKGGVERGIRKGAFGVNWQKREKWPGPKKISMRFFFWPKSIEAPIGLSNWPKSNWPKSSVPHSRPHPHPHPHFHPHPHPQSSILNSHSSPGFQKMSRKPKCVFCVVFDVGNA